MRTKFFLLFLIIFPLQVIFSLSGNQLDITSYQITPEGTYLGIARSYGFVVSHDRGISWEQKNTGLPKQVVYPYTGEETIHLTSLAVDPADRNRVAVTTYWGLYVSEDQGNSWKEIPLKKPIKHSAYITSAALSPFSDTEFLVGTSFSGFFLTENDGESWSEYRDILHPIYRGAGFYEEISSLAFDPEHPGTVYAAAGFGNGLYRADLENKTFSRIPFPGDKTSSNIRKVLFYPSAAAEKVPGYDLEVQADKAVWVRRTNGDTQWERKEERKSFRRRLPENEAARLEKASGRYGLYLKSWNASGESLKQFLQFVKDEGLNAIVVDMKDDTGRLTYDTSLELPKKMGALRKDIKIKELIEKAHEKGIYVIGRIVCFQDPELYRYEDNKYAVWNSRDKVPWANKIKQVDEETGETTWIQREFWVDPFSEFVWNYNLSIAKELQEKGIDEIQFDYIRFPSDGDFTGTQYRFRKEGMKKIDALESFLRRAREEISIPISTDLYGFNSWYRMGNWIGQCIEMASYYVDVICPMYYPSHFPRDFMKDTPYLQRAKDIYKEGSDRAAAITEGRSIIRPYVQAFLMGGELKFEEPTYWTYLVRQIEGTQEGDSSGFTLWNNSNKYYMVIHPLADLIGKKTEAASLME